MSDDPEFYCGVCGNTIIKPAEPYPFEEDKGPIGECCKDTSKQMKPVEWWVNHTTSNIENVIHPTDRWEGYLMTEADIHSLVCRVQQDAKAQGGV